MDNQINKDLKGRYCCKIKIDDGTCDGFKDYHFMYDRPNFKHSKCCKNIMMFLPINKGS